MTTSERLNKELDNKYYEEYNRNYGSKDMVSDNSRYHRELYYMNKYYKNRK